MAAVTQVQRVDVFPDINRQVFISRVHGTVAVSRCHGPEVLLSDVRFIVDAAGRERSLATSTKGFHAHVTGTVVTSPVRRRSPVQHVSYSLHQTRHYFYDVATGDRVVRAQLVRCGFDNDGKPVVQILER